MYAILHLPGIKADKADKAEKQHSYKKSAPPSRIGIGRKALSL